jgi:hypothetical protein
VPEILASLVWVSVVHQHMDVPQTRSHTATMLTVCPVHFGSPQMRIITESEYSLALWSGIVEVSVVLREVCTHELEKNIFFVDLVVVTLKII